MSLGVEGARELAGIGARFKFLLHKQDEKFLGVNLSDLHVSVRISVKKQLLGDRVRHELEDLFGLWGKLA